MTEPISNESSMTIAVAIAVAIHAVPLLLADPEPDEPINTDITCCFRCDGREEPPEDVPGFDEGPFRFSSDSQLTREQAIEQAHSGGIGSFHRYDYLRPRLPPRFPPISFDHGEIYLGEVECDWFCYFQSWKVREDPQLAAAMRKPAPAPLSIDPITVGGSLDKSTLRRVLKRNVSALARCQVLAEPSLTLGRTDPGALGTINAQLLIRGDGRVAQVTVADDRRDVVACIEHALSAIEFPRSPDVAPTQVNVPLRYGTTVASAGVLVR